MPKYLVAHRLFHEGKTYFRGEVAEFDEPKPRLMDRGYLTAIPADYVAPDKSGKHEEYPDPAPPPEPEEAASTEQPTDPTEAKTGELPPVIDLSKVKEEPSGEGEEDKEAKQ